MNWRHCSESKLQSWENLQKTDRENTEKNKDCLQTELSQKALGKQFTQVSSNAVDIKQLNVLVKINLALQTQFF